MFYSVLDFCDLFLFAEHNNNYGMSRRDYYRGSQDCLLAAADVGTTAGTSASSIYSGMCSSTCSLFFFLFLFLFFLITKICMRTTAHLEAKIVNCVPIDFFFLNYLCICTLDVTDDDRTVSATYAVKNNNCGSIGRRRGSSYKTSRGEVPPKERDENIIHSVYFPFFLKLTDE